MAMLSPSVSQLLTAARYLDYDKTRKALESASEADVISTYTTIQQGLKKSQDTLNALQAGREKYLSFAVLVQEMRVHQDALEKIMQELISLEIVSPEEKAALSSHQRLKEAEAAYQEEKSRSKVEIDALEIKARQSSVGVWGAALATLRKEIEIAQRQLATKKAEFQSFEKITASQLEVLRAACSRDEAALIREKQSHPHCRELQEKKAAVEAIIATFIPRFSELERKYENVLTPTPVSRRAEQQDSPIPLPGADIYAPEVVADLSRRIGNSIVTLEGILVKLQGILTLLSTKMPAAAGSSASVLGSAAVDVPPEVAEAEELLSVISPRSSRLCSPLGAAGATFSTAAVLHSPPHSSHRGPLGPGLNVGGRAGTSAELDR